MAQYRVRIIDLIEDPSDDNVDVAVEFDDGRYYVATFFTVANIQRLLDSYARTGECHHGLYLWASDMVIIREVTPEAIETAVADLLATGEFEGAFSRCEDEGEHPPLRGA